ncbi:MAG: hypothetical protein ACLFM4_05645 [Phormidium sp.]
MAIDLDLFSGSNYQSTIRNYCNNLGWKISDLNDRRTILKFTTESGTTQTVFIIRYDTTLEFSCPSGVKFRDKDSIPGWLSTLLLSQNSNFKIGFWAIEEIGNQHHFSIMHNAEISLIDVQYFGRTVLKLIDECEKLEQAVSRTLNNY